MKARRYLPGNERGAALLAVLAMVVLLAGFANLGLARLRLATDRISGSDARSAANALALSATSAARELAGQLKARARRQPDALTHPIAITTDGGVAELRFSDGGNCFNLNSLGRQSASALGATSSGQQTQAGPADFARLLAAAGIPATEADALAQATAARLRQTGMLWADASEWVTVPGVTAAHWQAAGALLCALPNHEAAAININSLSPAQAPILAAMGLGADEARRALAARPAGGWGTAGEFWQQASASGVPGTAAAQTLGTRSRWLDVSIVANAGAASAERKLLLDTRTDPARVAASTWIAIREQP